MKILVNAAGLDSRGAFSVVDSFLSDLKTNNKYLSSHNIFIEVLVARESLFKYRTNNIEIKTISYSKMKLFKKTIHEKIILPKVIIRGNYDAYLSLQNYGLNKINIPQFVLIHQAIPFSDLQFKELEFANFIKYKLFLHIIYLKQMKKIKGIFVQTNWIKEAIRKKYNYEGEINVVTPPLKDIYKKNKPLDKNISSLLETNIPKLLYVTSDEKYKNNATLVNAVEKYNKLHSEKVMLYLTINGQDQENIRYLGKIPYESMYSIYSNVNSLVYPSLTETLGLPILEAKEIGIDLIVADLPYSRELCGDQALYFNPRDEQSIINVIKTYVKTSRNNNEKNIKLNSKTMSYITFIEKIYKAI